MPLSGPSVSAFQPNSGVVVSPRKVMPAARIRATAGASLTQGRASLVGLP